MMRLGSTLAVLLFGLSSLVWAWPEFDPPPAPPLPLPQVSECLRFESPLYVAYVDKKTKLCRRIDYTVEFKHLGSVGGARGFRSSIRYRDFLLEHDDYTNSGYERGHLRALSLSAGHPSVDDVNSAAVIVPMTPKVNRETFRAAELYIERWARVRSVEVSIVCRYEKDVQMSNADEPHQVPSGFIVSVDSGGLQTKFKIDNTLSKEEP